MHIFSKRLFVSYKTFETTWVNVIICLQIRYLRRKEPLTSKEENADPDFEIADLSSESEAGKSCIDSDVISTSTVSSCGSSRRKAFSELDLKTIREECGHIIQSIVPINSADLKRLFQSNDRLVTLYDKYGFNSLKIKMRNERNRVMNK